MKSSSEIRDSPISSTGLTRDPVEAEDATGRGNVLVSRSFPG